VRRNGDASDHSRVPRHSPRATSRGRQQDSRLGQTHDFGPHKIADYPPILTDLPTRSFPNETVGTSVVTRADTAVKLAAGVLVLLSCWATSVFAQQTQNAPPHLPAWLADSYFSVNIGGLSQSFTSRQLEPGLKVQSIDEPHIAARVVLFGHWFTPWLGAQLSYMRPVQFVKYRNVNGDAASHSVWTGFGGATLNARAPLAGRTSIYGEAGLGIASRHGFDVDAAPAVPDASHAALLIGGGLEYRVSRSWDLTSGATIIRGNAADRESRALMIDGGFRYTMRQPQSARQRSRVSVDFRPDTTIQIEYTTAFGYSINTFLSTRVPVFWKGEVRVDRGVAVHVTRTVFRTRSLFSIDGGASVSIWRTRGGDSFATISVYPLFRFTPIRTRRVNAYVFYSLAGPTFVSSRSLDGLDLGNRFTFQDFLGGGVRLGSGKHIALGVKINHYSNGNIFPENAGVVVPLTFTLGWTF
jgi:hypothetical protein